MEMLLQFGPLLDLSAPEVIHEPTAQLRGIRWASRFLEYARVQLLDLRPGGRAVSLPPLEGFPPPNLLIGYYYLARTLNLYLFNQRIFSNISYQRVLERTQPRMLWTILTDCGYDLDVGELFQSINDPNEFGDTLYQMQQAVLRDRILSDLPVITGRGAPHTSTSSPQSSPPPSSLTPPTDPAPTRLHECVNLQNEQRRTNIFYGRSSVPFPETFQFADIPTHDQLCLKAIRSLKTAALKYTLLSQEEQVKPFLDLPYNDDWMTTFVDVFNSIDLSERSGKASDFRTIACCLSDGAYTTFNEVHVLEEPDKENNYGVPSQQSMRGGAMRLRSGTVIGTPFRLRPRDNGRPITQEMRRRRGEAVRRFIDSLPIRRRRRRALPSEDAPVSPIPSPPSLLAPDDGLLNDDDPGEGTSSRYRLPPIPHPPPSPPPPHVDFADAVLESIATAIEELRIELGPRYQNVEFFTYTGAFYQLLAEVAEQNELTDDFLARWLMYFFATEHIAATLFYLERTLKQDANASRYITIQSSQVIVRARDDSGNILFTRVWDDNGDSAFITNYRRVLQDFVVMTGAVAREIDTDVVEEREQLLEDIRYREHSGDPTEIFRQAALQDLNVNSLDLSFRVKTTGYVAYTSNRRWRDQYLALRNRAITRWRAQQVV